MKKFLLKIALFFSINFVILASCLIFVNGVIRVKADFKINPNTKYVIFGHSHSKCAFNDSLIENFQNISNNGESYFYTLPKLKQVIIQNPNIETVFVEFTNSQISKDIESWIWDEKYLSYHYCFYSPFINLNDKMLLIWKNPKEFIANLSVDFKSQIKIIASNNYNYIKYSGFTKVSGDLKEYLKNKDESKDDVVKINRIISEIHLKYLDKIIKFVQQKGKKLILVRSPIHKEYKEYFANEDLFQNLLKTRYKGVDFLDFHDIYFPDSCYKDFRHLNYYGASKFSKWFDFLVKNGLLESNNRKAFISENDKIFNSF